MIVVNSETQYIVKELNLLNESGEKEEKSNGVKRKRGGSDDEDSNDEEEEEEDEDEDDEEIYSDTDEEMRADEMKKAKKMKKLHNFEFKPIELDSLEDYLAKFHQSFHSYRQSTIQKWYDKTRLITGKSFQSLEKPIIQQIEHVTLD